MIKITSRDILRNDLEKDIEVYINAGWAIIGMTSFEMVPGAIRRVPAKSKHAFPRSENKHRCYTVIFSREKEG